MASSIRTLSENERRAEAHKKLAVFSGQRSSDVRTWSPKPEAARKSLWAKWMTYTQRMFDVDGAQLWIDLCVGGPEGFKAENMMKAFLSDYVEHSVTSRVSLGPDEYELVRTVKSGNTVDELWGMLVAHANATVLQDKRREDPTNHKNWRIAYYNRPNEDGGVVAAHRMALWIREDLIDLHGLTRDQTFTKEEATEEDILLYLDTLWSQAEHIPCSAAHRAAFHCIVVMSGICGFRPGSLLSLPYSQFQIRVVRSSGDDGPLQIIVTPTVYHNKRRQKIIKKSQDDKISWSVPLIPCPLLDLTSFLVARALADDAFDAGFTTVDELLTRPRLGQGQNCATLSWKEEMLDKPMISISYPSFWKLWRQVGLVSGLRNRVRPYSLRVGAGGRLDGTLTSALRGYILSNTDVIYQRSYQPAHIGINLGHLAFKAVGDGQDELFALLRRSTLMRDPNAPIYPTKKDVESWEQRKDIQELRKNHKVLRKDHPADHPEFRKILARIQTIRDDLEDLTVLRLRQKYFKRLDRNVALGHDFVRDPNRASETPRRGSRTHKSASDAAAAIGTWLNQRGGHHQKQPQQFIQLLVDFLSSNFSQVGQNAGPPIPGSTISDPTLSPAIFAAASAKADPVGNQYDKDTPRCLFGCGPFYSRPNLTRHVYTQHVNKGSFNQPFNCPECSRLGLPAYSVDSPSGWSHHAEMRHGKINAPYLKTGTSPGKTSAPPLKMSTQVSPSDKMTPGQKRRASQEEHLVKTGIDRETKRQRRKPTLPKAGQIDDTQPACRRTSGRE